MSTQTMYVLLSNREFCDNVKAVSGGEFCYIAPNYIQLYPEEITNIEDRNTHCHAVEVPEGDIKEVQDGQSTNLFLWKGPHGIRDNVNNTSTLPITKACNLCNDAEAAPAAPTEPVDPPQEEPLEVRFARNVLELNNKELDSWPNMGKSSVKEWKDRAKTVIAEHADKAE